MKYFDCLACLACLVLVAPAVAETPEEKDRNARFAALVKAGDALVQKDFQGHFANYWHTNIDAARASYEAALKEDYGVGQKVELLCRIADCRLEATRDVEGALKSLDEAIALAGGNEAARKRASDKKASVVALVDGSAFAPKPAEKGATSDESMSAVVGKLFAEGGFNRVIAELPARVAAAQAKADAAAKADPKAARACYAEVWTYFSNWYFLRNVRTSVQNHRGARTLVAKLMEAAPKNQRPPADQLFAYLADEVEARDICARLAREAGNRPEAKFFLTMYDAHGDADKVVRAFETTNRVEMAENLGKAAKWLLKGGDEAAARRVWAKREAIVPPPAQPVLDMAYWADAPHDIRGIVESERYRKAEKGYLNRRYGNNLKFLIETDSALLGRQMTTDDGKSFRPTEVFAFWDRFGVKIMLRSFVDDPEAMRDGLLDPGGYEAYLATGDEDPYHCVMIDSREGGRSDDSFVTQYNNGTGFRRFTTKDGTLRLDTLYLEDGAATLLSIPWTAAFAATPWKREAWYFEPIHWAHGGLSWGGSMSVHYRSMFGKLRFTGGDDASYAAVKRQLVFAAKECLAQACSPHANGCVERWQDPELGDQEFYLARVKPLVTRLSEALGAVNAKTDAAGVFLAYDQAVDDALNIDYLVSRLRTEWIEEMETR